MRHNEEKQDEQFEVIRISLQNKEVQKLFHKLSRFLIKPTKRTSEELEKYGFKTIQRKGEVSVHVVPRKIRNVLKICQICA